MRSLCFVPNHVLQLKRFKIHQRVPPFFPCFLFMSQLGQLRTVGLQVTAIPQLHLWFVALCLKGCARCVTWPGTGWINLSDLEKGVCTVRVKEILPHISFSATLHLYVHDPVLFSVLATDYTKWW